MDELVRTLSKGSHPVKLVLRPEQNIERLRESLQRHHMHVKFTETRGGTELGVRIDEDTAQCALAATENGDGTIHIAGNLVLNYERVRCVADIDLTTYQGTGHLEPVDVDGDAV
jgi:hypothetical protein